MRLDTCLCSLPKTPFSGPLVSAPHPRRPAVTRPGPVSRASRSCVRFRHGARVTSHRRTADRAVKSLTASGAAAPSSHRGPRMPAARATCAAPRAGRAGGPNRPNGNRNRAEPVSFLCGLRGGRPLLPRVRGPDGLRSEPGWAAFGPFKHRALGRSDASQCRTETRTAHRGVAIACLWAMEGRRPHRHGRDTHAA